MCNDSSNNNPFSRRSFLGGALTLGAGTFLFDPFRSLTEGIADGLIMKAYGESGGVNASRNYINIQMPGAPLRYQFDQWLRVSNSDPALAMVAATKKINPMIANSFTIDSQGKVDLAYKTFAFNNVLAPHMFSHHVYNSKGQKRPLTDLLKHMLVVRGFGSGLDGHQFNMLAQQVPIGGVSTISGLVAENTKATFDSVQWPDRGGNGAFVSNQGKAQSKVGGTKPLNTLMEGFGQPSAKGTRNLKTAHAEAMELAQARLKAYSRSENTGAKVVSQNLSNASNMMKKGVGNLDSFWTDAVARYKAAIEASMREINLVGISDKPLTSDESAIWNLGTGDIIKQSKERDVREAIKNVSLQNYAESLAMAEYLIKQGLSNSIDIRADALMNLSILTPGTTAATARNLGLDMHATGGAAAVLFATSYYRGIAAGILELMDQLGPQVWQNTVVQVQGDFGRTARSNGSGSDHGFNQMVTSAYSGAFSNGPVVVGNIKLAGHSAAYDGTQGIAAEIPGYNQKGMPSPTMASATVTTLLGVDHNPYKNTAASLVSLTNGTLKPVVPAKIVA
ncbi:DUF1501 domain-containing protein [Bdellovibrio sp. 22V]|uniref:DUF1501 domain-containing protein n=1 Tax=Bdellovibrio TaxID=958 RepID=UPI002543A5E8|nr:DUF1501 domain-containing protein [Bdellovibrio sp. 22V]WII72905.1 DUF1501 domain-containing protein [Bdellovibrio sp. 22V]